MMLAVEGEEDGGGAEEGMVRDVGCVVYVVVNGGAELAVAGRRGHRRRHGRSMMPMPSTTSLSRIYKPIGGCAQSVST